MYVFKAMSPYIRAKFRNVTKDRNLPREHNERMQFRDRNYGTTIPY